MRNWVLKTPINNRLGHSKKSGDPSVVSAVPISPAARSESPGLVLTEVCGCKPQKQSPWSFQDANEAWGTGFITGAPRNCSIRSVTSGSEIGMNQPSISSFLYHCCQGSKSGKTPAGPAGPHACPWQSKHPDWQSSGALPLGESHSSTRYGGVLLAEGGQHWMGCSHESPLSRSALGLFVCHDEMIIASAEGVTSLQVYSNLGVRVVSLLLINSNSQITK